MKLTINELLLTIFLLWAAVIALGLLFIQIADRPHPDDEAKVWAEEMRGR